MAFLLKMVKKDEDFYTKCWEIIVTSDSGTEFKKILEQCPGVVNEKNPRGDTLLHQATLYARTQIIEVLLQNGSDINALDQYGDTPLFWALQYTPPSKRLECVVLMVNNGANIELGEQTPLWLAACYGYLPIVEFLVEKGADTNALVAYSGKKFTPKEVAQDKGHSDVWQFLQFNDAVNVIKKGDNLASIKKLFEQQPKIAKKKDRNNYTLLHHSAFYGRSTIVQFLLPESDTNFVNNSNETPLFCAIAEMHEDCAIMLIESGCDVDIPDKDGCSPFWKAAVTGQAGLIPILAKAGADILSVGTFLEDGQNYSPKQIAKLKGHNSIEAIIQELEISFIPKKSIPRPLQMPKSLPPPLPATVYNSSEDYANSPLIRHLTPESTVGLAVTVPILPKSISEVVPPRSIPNLDLSKMSKPREIRDRDPAGTPAYLRQSSSPAFFTMSNSPRDPSQNPSPAASPAVHEILIPSQSDEFPDPRAPVESEFPLDFPDPRQMASPRPMTAPVTPSKLSPRNSSEVSFEFPDPRQQSPRPMTPQQNSPRSLTPRPITPPDAFPDPRSTDLTPTMTPRDASHNPTQNPTHIDIFDAFGPRASSQPLLVPTPLSVSVSAPNASLSAPTSPMAGDFDPRGHMSAVNVLGTSPAMTRVSQSTSSIPNFIMNSSPLPIHHMPHMNQPVTVSMSPPAMPVMMSPPVTALHNHTPLQQTIGFNPNPNLSLLTPNQLPNQLPNQIPNFPPSVPIGKRFSVDDHQMSQNQKRTSFEELMISQKRFSSDALTRGIGPSTNPSLLKTVLDDKNKLPTIVETPLILSPRESDMNNTPDLDLLSNSPKRFFDSNGIAAKTRELHTVVQPRFLPNIIPGDIVGKGQFGQVFKGIMDGSEVALKKFYQPNISNEQWVLHLSLETRHWVSLRHPNVVAFLGLYHDNVDSYYLCTEFVPLRSLSGFLRNPFYVSMLDAKNLVKMAISATLGMIYLGERQIIHGNLATRNLMVFKEDENTFSLKVDDYGITQDVSSEAFKGSEIAPFKWTAPEVFKTHTFTIQSDVWSFGVVLWEMFEPEKTPYQDMSYQETVDFLEKGFRLAVPENAPTGVQQLISECWRVTPEKRPTFTEILKRLEGITYDHIVPLAKDGEVQRM